MEKWFMNPIFVHCGNNLCYDPSHLSNVQCAGVRSVRSPTSGWRKHKLLGSLKISAINIFSVKMVCDKWWQSFKSCVLTKKYCTKSSQCTVCQIWKFEIMPVATTIEENGTVLAKNGNIKDSEHKTSSKSSSRHKVSPEICIYIFLKFSHF